MISNNKRGRGRPRKYSDWHLRLGKGMGTRANTERQLQNGIFTFMALWALSGRNYDDEFGEFLKKGRRLIGGVESWDFEIPPRYSWLYDKSQADKRPNRYYKATILAELGRLEDPKEIRRVAKAVCKAKHGTKVATAGLRNVRLGTEKSGDSQQLAMEIVRTILHYRVRYPEMQAKGVQEALSLE